MSALEGLVVVDFTWNLPGPYCTRLLAERGAEVVKIEPPRGDPGRNIPPLFERLNGGKRSIRLDMKTPEAVEEVRQLVQGADVLVEGFRPGVMDRLGCGYETVRGWNPRLIYCSISAFGQHGPGREIPGHDLNLQALSGLCHLERDARGRPRPSVLPVADLSVGLAAVAEIGLALVERERTGVGCHVDVAMLDSVADWTQTWAVGANLLAPLEDVGPVGKAAAKGPWFRGLRRRRLYALPHYGVYRCLDGRWLAVGIVDENRFWRSFCKVLGLRGVGRMPLPARVALGPALEPLVRARMRTRTRTAWLRDLEAADVPVTPVLTPEEASGDPRVAIRLGRTSSSPGPRG